MHESLTFSENQKIVEYGEYERLTLKQYLRVFTLSVSTAVLLRHKCQLSFCTQQKQK